MNAKKQGKTRADELVRKLFAEVMQTERSARRHLLGMHHGVDLLTLFHRAAGEAKDDDELEGWCRTWLGERRKLLERAIDALSWFAENADIAMADAKLPFEKKRA